jgi:hypothetical protein
MEPKFTISNDSGPQVELTQLMKQYTQLLCEQLRSARNLLSNSVQEVMADSMKINAAVENGRAEAEKVLEAVFLAPDEETQHLVEAMQRSTGEVFDSAQTGGKLQEEGVTQAAELARQVEVKFQKHIDHFGEIERLVADTLVKMTGALSTDDVIAHYMRHVSASMRAFEAGLSAILLDFEGRCTVENVHRLRTELHDFNEKQYSSTEERQTLQKYFPKAS